MDGDWKDEDAATVDAVLQDIPHGLVVKDPNALPVRIRRKQLTLAHYQKQAHIQQLTDELAEIDAQLTTLGGRLGGYTEYAGQLQPLARDATQRALRARGDAVTALATTMRTWMPIIIGTIAVIAGIGLLILLIALTA